MPGNQQHQYHTDFVPAWEKRFGLDMGGMKWKNFFYPKQDASKFTKIMEWYDSAGKESFQQAKKRFWAKNRLPCKLFPLPSPDMYIDQINWNAKLDPQLFLDLEEARRQVQDHKEGNDCISLADIKPTGWDVDCEEWHKPLVLTGMIVGD
ncbi:hypothetical protein P3X46_030362 [Hevea brasiliensis]|uniref:Uncharacterized protein n=1 Tax=Hevea brasiliensis TaxID=3981 RepID=A0ABQ9KH31_HEVBR|nr:uncharacterized protein LOC131175472 [Hevea brasiliensis]KAJ9139649.1 hypothetical protein P3X46_030362 [Hevea brasiliensis]